mmetsp:Transcript_35991/g.64390  ORF Transcript_35991/g.64390 Transcript_35991/m.64390 type:complete len:285 (+) Transcript_35991:2037-2891(+)
MVGRVGETIATRGLAGTSGLGNMRLWKGQSVGLSGLGLLPGEPVLLGGLWSSTCWICRVRPCPLASMPARAFARGGWAPLGGESSRDMPRTSLTNEESPSTPQGLEGSVGAVVDRGENTSSEAPAKSDGNDMNNELPAAKAAVLTGDSGDIGGGVRGPTGPGAAPMAGADGCEGPSSAWVLVKVTSSPELGSTMARAQDARFGLGLGSGPLGAAKGTLPKALTPGSAMKPSGLIRLRASLTAMAFGILTGERKLWYAAGRLSNCIFKALKSPFILFMAFATSLQ